MDPQPTPLASMEGKSAFRSRASTPRGLGKHRACAANPPGRDFYPYPMPPIFSQKPPFPAPTLKKPKPPLTRDPTPPARPKRHSGQWPCTPAPPEHLRTLAYNAWDLAFEEGNVKYAWFLAGLQPFSRLPAYRTFVEKKKRMKEFTRDRPAVDGEALAEIEASENVGRTLLELLPRAAQPSTLPLRPETSMVNNAGGMSLDGPLVISRAPGDVPLTATASQQVARAKGKAKKEEEAAKAKRKEDAKKKDDEKKEKTAAEGRRIYEELRGGGGGGSGGPGERREKPEEERSPCSAAAQRHRPLRREGQRSPRPPQGQRPRAKGARRAPRGPRSSSCDA